MTTKQFRRVARLAGPRMPEGEIHLETPPELSRPLPRNILIALLPVVMIAGMVGFIVVLGANTTSMMMGGMMMMSMIGMMASGAGRQGKSPAALDEERKDYLGYLDSMRGQIRRTAAGQRAAQLWTHPDPAALMGIARSRRLWERRGTDPDYCQVRIALGNQRLSTRIVPPQTGPVEELEPVSAVALRRLVRAHATVADLPIAVQLRSFAAISVTGDGARSLTRAIICQAAVMHAPDDLIVAVVSSGADRARWEWTKWLPHAQHPTENDAVGRLRMVAGSLSQVEDWLGPMIAERGRFNRGVNLADGPQILIVLDGGSVTGEERILAQDGLVGVALIDLTGVTGNLAARRGLRLISEAGRVGAQTPRSTEWLGAADEVSEEVAESIARELAPWRVGTDSATTDQPLVSATGLTELLGLGDAGSIDTATAWRPRSMRDRLRIPIGLGADGQPVELDIKEAAQDGMGPHGLIIGATGSGKSEVLRTLVMGLAVTHSSAALNFVLVDFKGGATFLGLQDLPHVAAVITNLSDDLTMVDRMKDALAGEMNRRQELLKSAGNFASVKDYERARENGANLEPLPALLIVCDEFTELLTQKSDFAELFVAIGRLGRSLSMHLLLASQRLEEGKMRGLDSHLSYRIGLKTFSAAESRAVLDVPDAYELPPIPGSGFLKFDTTSMVRFKSAYVSGPYRNQTQAPETVLTADRQPRVFGADFVPVPLVETPEEVVEEAPVLVDGVEQTVMDVIVSRLVGQGPPAHEVWLPPLTESPTLDQLLPPLSVTAERGLGPVGWSGNGRLQVPIALVDKPFEQRRDLLWADFSGSAGHGLVVGGPQSGKSTMLRSIIASLALSHTPAEVQFYCIDLGGGTLGGLADLPHVGGVGTRNSPDVVRRIVAEVATVVAEREQRFREVGIDSMAGFRQARAAGRLPDDKFGDVFLVIDGWGAVRTEFEEIEPQITAIAQQGLSFGVHVLIGVGRWAEVRPALKDLILSRFELRLGDPSESEIERRTAATVPSGIPGRGLTQQKLHFLAALPRIDSVSGTEDLSTGVAAMITSLREAWAGPAAPPVRLLPERLGTSALPGPAEDGGRKEIPVGINEAQLAPVYLDFNADPHFLLMGDAESGKTTFLRTLAKGITSRYGPREARILLVDYRRTLLQVLPQEYMAGYAVSASALDGLIADVVGLLRSRLPGPDITPEQLRDRSWWSGAELYILVDDYDLVVSPSGNPLAPLAEFLPQAKDVGLHLVLCRRVGGASRAMFEPILQRVRELGSAGIILSGSKDEGVLLGNTKAAPMPPGRGMLVTRRVGQQLMQIASDDSGQT